MPGFSCIERPGELQAAGLSTLSISEVTGSRGPACGPESNG